MAAEPAAGAAGQLAQRWGAWLVTLQFAVLGVMAWRAWQAHGRDAPRAAVMALLVAAVVVGVAALAANRPGNFNIRPLPKAHGELVTRGPYRWIRHPMYTALLLGSGGAALWSGAWIDAASWVALLVVLAVKASVEERALIERFAGYAAYRARTSRFLPWVY
jgi:protein-S-isoprenylcysteine O-methyltransferase Ste14